MNKIQEVAPVLGRESRTQSISDFHPPLPADRYAMEVRLGYAYRLPLIMQYAVKGRNVAHSFLCFEYTPNAQSAYYTACSEGLALYPQFPVFHLLLTLACPWRKLAVLVEEEETPWTADQMHEEDRLLSLSGWRVFRIPAYVARLVEEDVLPDHLFEGRLGNFQYEGEREEYEGYAEQLRVGTRDAFFRWLKREHFSREALTRYQLRDQQEETARLITRPRPTPEQEAEALMHRLYGPSEEVERKRFEVWAQLKGYNTMWVEGDYFEAMTTVAWQAWREACGVATPESPQNTPIHYDRPSDDPSSPDFSYVDYGPTP